MITDTLSALLKKYGIDTHGVVKSIDQNGFNEFYQTVENYEFLEKSGKLTKVSKGLFGVSCLFAAVDVFNSGIKANEAGENSDIIIKQSFIKNATTIGLTYLFSAIGSEIGQAAGERIGSSIGTAISPGGGTILGASIGAATGSFVGSYAFGTVANEMCNYVFEEKLGW